MPQIFLPPEAKQRVSASLGQKASKPKQDFPAPAQPDPVASMKNNEKLTPLERGIYKALPGFSQSTVGQALAKFGQSWAGKALSFLDVAAEGVERTSGLVVQQLNKQPGEDLDLQSAWYAGSLLSDNLNLPVFTRDSNGTINGMRIPTDLPGTAGLGEARQKIAALIKQGVEPGEALVKARDDYYNGLGALALRAQLHDTYFHVLADPLNYILPTLKPVEALQAARVTALTEKSAYTAEEVLKFAEDAAKLSKTAATAEDIANATQEAARLTKFAEKLQAGTVQKINSFDKFAIMMTGGDIFNPSKASQAVSKIPILNLFQLTPESKAKELISMLSDNISARIVGKLYGEADAERLISEAVSRAANGSKGLEFGHSMMTVEGRSAQAFLTGADSLASQAYADYKGLATERGLLKVMTTALGDTEESILKSAGENADVLVKRLANTGIPEIQQALQDGTITSETLGTLADALKGLPYNKDTFIVHLLAKIEDHAMQQAIVQFGVKERGLITRWSNAMKSAESLAFMRLNPTYGIRNLVNNDVTMVARGVFGLMTPQEIDAFWKTAGFTPSRLAEGFTVAGQQAEANKVLEKALSAGKNGAPERIQNFFRNVSLGKVDVTKWSRGIESSASKRAFTSGFTQFMREHWTPKSVVNELDSSTIDAMRRVNPELPEAIDAIVKSARGIDSKLQAGLGGNLHISTQSVFDSASKDLGYKVEDVLGHDTLDYLESKLPEAIAKGQTEKLVLDMQSKVEQHIEDVFQSNLDDLVGNISNQMKVGGPQVMYDKIAEAQDLFWSAHTEHAIRSPGQWSAFTEAKSAGEFAKADSVAVRNLAADEKFFSRTFRRVDAYLQGLEKGSTEAGINFPKDVRSAFGDFQKNWKDFFSFRNGEYDRIRKLDWKERGAAYDTLRGQLRTKYDSAVALENQVQQRVDDAVANLIDDPAQKSVFMTWRDQMAQLNAEYKKSVVDLWDNLPGVPKEERAKVLNEFQQQRALKYENMRQTGQFGMAAMQGDQTAAQMFSPNPQAGGTIYDLANQYGISSASAEGARNDQRILNTVNKYSETKYKTIAEISVEDAQKAFDARALEKGTAVPAKTQEFVSDYKKLVDNLKPLDLGTDEVNYGRQQNALNSIVDAAKAQAKKTPVLLENLPQDVRDKVTQFLEQTRADFGDARLGATRFAEFRRDSALLNYNRRSNFDSYVANIFPFAFWTTGSIQKWAIESIDRPAMLTTYLRMKKLLEAAGSPRQGFPSRFKDNIRIPLPFAPAWMGDQFIDPINLALPFDSFMQPIEQYQQTQLTLNGRAERLLADQLQNNQLSQNDYEEAMMYQGPAWDQAIAQAQQNDESLKYDAWDFASLVSSPHAPLVWAYNLARGHPEDIGPFSPGARTIKNVATTLGVKDWNNSPLNIEGKIRKTLGLPAFDKWDDYRVDRELSNLAADGKFSTEDIQRAMIDRSGPAFEEAVTRANQEYSGGAVGTVAGLLGIPVHSYPTGEQTQRQLQSDFSAAYDKYKKANDDIQKFMDSHPDMSQKDALLAYDKSHPNNNADALTKFFDAHPEYETRLALFKTPEERLRQFLVDKTWEKWNDLPDVTKKELQAQLGNQFNDAFLNKDTRSYDSLNTAQMQVWLKMMGGNPPGTMSADQKLLTDLFSGQLQLTKPETANRAQIFYDTRNQNFPNWYQEQNDYYDKNSPSFKKAPMELKQYWDWRRGFLTDNPDLVPYLTDDQKAIEKAAKAQRNPQVAVPTAQEIQVNLSPSMQALLKDAQNGDPLPPQAEMYIQALANSYGMSEEQLRNIIGAP